MDILEHRMKLENIYVWLLSFSIECREWTFKELIT